jgi:hypothetical protein
MKNFRSSQKFIAVLLASVILFSGCSSSTLIRSSPSGAKVYLNGEAVGTTPYSHTDTKIVGTTTQVLLEKEGYEPLNVSFSRDEEVDVGAIIGGVFFLVPFLWTMKYKPLRTYEMKPISGVQVPFAPGPGDIQMSASKADKLRELKELLDDQIITPAEFEKEKKKILEEDSK